MIYASIVYQSHELRGNWFRIAEIDLFMSFDEWVVGSFETGAQVLTQTEHLAHTVLC